MIVLVTTASTKSAALAQTPQTKPGTEDILKEIDQLIEQNRRLEQQNRELIEQINSLRQSLVNQGAAPQTALAPQPAGGAATTAGTAPPTAQPGQSGAGSTQRADATTGSSDQNLPNNDDKTLLPQASGGNPAIFGEFNPGRGFTVAKGEYGELNLSGYMAVRYLNQLPPNQNETDHLGRPSRSNPATISSFIGSCCSLRVGCLRRSFNTPHSCGQCRTRIKWLWAARCTTSLANT